MTERVTDEWLKRVSLDAYDSTGCESISDDTEAMIALHRAVSQAVARECVRLLNDMQDENVETDYYTDCADAIRARFGLED